MRIYELFERQAYRTVRNLSPQRMYAHRSNKWEQEEDDPNNTKVQGSAYGRPSISNPDTYHRVEHGSSSPEENAYYQYVNAVANLDNPYYPKLLSRRTLLNPKTGKEKSLYKLEKLYTEKDVPLDQLVNMVQNTFTLGTNTAQNINSLSAKEVWNRVAKSLNLAVKQGNTSIIKDPKLIDATHLIRELISRNPGFHPDLHSNNIMLRKLTDSVQLVIIDPIGFDRRRATRAKKLR